MLVNTNYENALLIINKLIPKTHNEPVKLVRDNGEVFKTPRKVYNIKVKKGITNIKNYKKIRKVKKANTVRLKKI